LATAQLVEVVGADLLVVAVPAQAVRAVLGVIARLVTPMSPVVIAAKGLERGSAKRMTQVADEALDEQPAKTAFWNAFKQLGPWWAELPPY
jgi:glycerol-3-phosphate dehydrogenase (NAD(P)+)